jgi:hypothetical protein
VIRKHAGRPKFHPSFSGTYPVSLHKGRSRPSRLAPPGHPLKPLGVAISAIHSPVSFMRSIPRSLRRPHTYNWSRKAVLRAPQAQVHHSATFPGQEEFVESRLVRAPSALRVRGRTRRRVHAKSQRSLRKGNKRMVGEVTASLEMCRSLFPLPGNVGTLSSVPPFRPAFPLQCSSDCTTPKRIRAAAWASQFANGSLSGLEERFGSNQSPVGGSTFFFTIPIGDRRGN